MSMALKVFLYFQSFFFSHNFTCGKIWRLDAWRFLFSHNDSHGSSKALYLKTSILLS